MLRKTMAVMMTAVLITLCISAAFAAGLFAEMAARDEEYADQRLSPLDGVADPVAVSMTAADGMTIEVSQAYYEGNRVFISYRISANTDLMELHEGVPDEGIEWMQVLDDWVAETYGFSDFADVRKEDEWLDGQSQHWLKAPYDTVAGLCLEDGTKAEAVAGYEYKQQDGSLIGWRECVVPAEKTAEMLTFGVIVDCVTAIKYQDYTTFREYWTAPEQACVLFSLNRNDEMQYLQGVSQAGNLQAQADLVMGKVDLKGTIRLVSADQVKCWQPVTGETGPLDVDMLLGWKLYQDGQALNLDGFRSASVEGEDTVVYELQFPFLENTSGLTLIPEYVRSGEHPGEGILLEPVGGNQVSGYPQPTPVATACIP